MSAFFSTFMSTGLKEDVRDLLTVLSPDDAPVFNLLGDGDAQGVRHEWLTIPLPTASDNAHYEGTAWEYASADTPAETRKQNYTQIFIKTWRVSGTVEAVAKYGRASEWELRKMHALRAFTVDIEYELLDNTASGAGAESSARDMKGIPGAAMDGGITATAHQTAASRAPITMVSLNTLLQDMWTQGANPDTLVCGAFVKRAISGFVGSDAGRPVVNENGERLISSVIDVYESDFGRVNIIPSRRLNQKSEVLAFQKDLLSKAWLRSPTTEVAPKDGDYLPGVVVAELTLEYLNPYGVGRLTRVSSA